MTNFIHGRSPLALALAQSIGLKTEGLVGFTLTVRVNDVARVSAEYLASAPADSDASAQEVRFRLVPIEDGQT